MYMHGAASLTPPPAGKVMVWNFPRTLWMWACLLGRIRDALVSPPPFCGVACGGVEGIGMYSI